MLLYIENEFNLESYPHDLIVMLVKKKIPISINLSPTGTTFCLLSFFSYKAI